MAKGFPDNGRYLHIYTRSLEQKQKFDSIARESGASSSNFYLNIIEEALSEEPRPPTVNKEIEELVEQNIKLREEVRIKSIIMEKYEKELRKLTVAPFLDQNFQGSRSIDPKLIAIIKSGPIGDYRLLDALQIDPSDSKIVSAITNQLEILESYGIIEKGSNGWRWSK